MVALKWTAWLSAVYTISNSVQKYGKAFEWHRRQFHKHLPGYNVSKISTSSPWTAFTTSHTTESGSIGAYNLEMFLLFLFVLVALITGFYLVYLNPFRNGDNPSQLRAKNVYLGRKLLQAKKRRMTNKQNRSLSKANSRNNN